MNTTAKVLVGFLAGATLGTVTALLMAPYTGKTTRKNLNKKAKKMVKQLEGVLGKQKATGKKSSQVAASHKNGRASVASH